MPTIRFKLPKITQVEFSIECQEEHVDFVGNCSAIDEETDKANEDYIRQELNSGNYWAWCTVKVIAKYKGLTGTDYLGACSYKSENDFKKDGYWEAMKEQAFEDLIIQLRALKD